MKTNTACLFELEDKQMVLMILEGKEEDELAPKEELESWLLFENLEMDGVAL